MTHRYGNNLILCSLDLATPTPSEGKPYPYTLHEQQLCKLHANQMRLEGSRKHG